MEQLAGSSLLACVKYAERCVVVVEANKEVDFGKAGLDSCRYDAVCRAL